MTSSDSQLALALTERQKTVAFITVLVAVVLEVADSTIVNTALPAIRVGLNASSAAMQWIVAGYLLTLGSLLLLGGRLGDAFGHARVFLFGVGFFVIASALCGLAQSANQLVAARMLQGVAGAAMAPQTMAIVQILYTPLERVAKLAYFGVIVGLAAIVGPIVGGILIELDLFGLGWRLIFLINLPIGIGAIIVGLASLPKAEPERELRIDPIGALIFACGLGGIYYAVIEGAERGWGLGKGLLAVTAAALLTFGWRRARIRRMAGKPSIIEPRLFDIETFRFGVLASLCFSVASMGFLLVFSISLQQGLGLTALQTALIHIPFGAGVMLGVGFLVPKLLPRMGKRLPLMGGALMIGALILVIMRLSGGDGGSSLLVAFLLAAGVGMGTLSGPLGPIVVANVERGNAGTASATLRTAQQIGGATGIALIGAAYFSASGGDTQKYLNGLIPASVAITLALALSVFAVSRLPKNLFESSTGKAAAVAAPGE